MIDKDMMALLVNALHLGGATDDVDELIKDKRKLILCPYPQKTCKQQIHSTTWTGEFKGEKHYRCTKWEIDERTIKRHCGLP